MKKILSLITLLFLSFVSLSQTITTVAGGGIGVQFPTDGSPALGSNMNPTGIAFSKSGELLIVGDNRLCKVDSFGMIFRIAGNGTNINTGDGYAAINSQLNSSKVAVNKNGDIFLTGFQSHLRKINLLGNIDSINIYGYSSPTQGDVKCDTNGNVYSIFTELNVVKTDLSNNGIFFAGAGGGNWYIDSMSASNCNIKPVGIAVDKNNNIYVADRWSQRILKITPNGAISTYVGNGIPSPLYQNVAGSYTGDNGYAASAGLNIGSTPTTIGMAFDKNNNLYFSDINNHAIRKVDDITGIITTVIDSSELKYPSSLAFDKDDNLFVVDYGNKRVRKIDFSNGPNSIKDTKIDKTISVYPNPFQDILVLKSDLEINSIQIVNTLGQNVLSQKGNKSNSVTIDTKTLKSGLYFININNNISKIIKQ